MDTDQKPMRDYACCKTIACYTLFGIVFGLMFPLIGMGADYLLLRPGFGTLTERVRTNPIHAIVALAPFVLGFVFHIIGRIQWALREKNEDLKLALARVRHADTAKETILSTVADGIVCVDDDGISTTFNTSAQEIFGYTEDEVIGRPVAILLPDASANLFRNYVATFTPAAEAALLASRPVLDGKRKSGDFFPMEVGLKRSVHDGRRIFVGVLRDITEREQAEALKNEFIATVSHELRTPLTSIYGPLSLLQSGGFGALSDTGQRTVEIAIRNCKHLLALINNLLDFEKLSSGRATFDLAGHDIRRLVTEAMQDNEGYAMSCDVSMALTGTARGALVSVDEERFGQVLRNLLSNALKFSDAGQRVEIDIAIADGRTVVSVIDHGVGIPADKFDRIFRRFSQVDGSATRKKGGTGLGLAISKELTEQMGGDIGFTTEFGQGSTFWVAFPVLQDLPEDAEDAEFHRAQGIAPAEPAGGVTDRVA